MNPMDVQYRRTAAAGAGGMTLLIALYDTLAGDLRRAARAQRERDLEQRSVEVKHALTVLAALDNWIDPESGELAQKLIAFYAGLRRKMMQAQATQSAEMLEWAMGEVLRVRETWQQVNEKPGDAAPFVLPPVARQQSNPFAAEAETRRMSWSV